MPTSTRARLGVRSLFIAQLAIGAILLGACSAAGSPVPTAPNGPPATPVPAATATPGTGPSGSPSPGPTGTPDTGAIAHPDGATTVVLRYESGGGFVPPDFLATQVPAFTLYGDGTVLYRPATAEMPARAPGDPVRYAPLRVASLTEDQVQALLVDALTSGLAVARDRYENQQIADAPTTFFTLDANGIQKRVEVYALGIDTGGGPDSAILARLAGLADRLANFDPQVAAGKATDVGAFRPDRFRATLIEGAAGDAAPITWPWTGFGPSSFSRPPDGSLPSRAISGADAGQLGLADIEGGVSGITIKVGSTTYGLGLRPLLPDEVR